MRLPNFLSLPRSKTKTEADAMGDPTRADLAVRHPGAPGPGLGTGSSTLPTSGSLASYDCRSSGTQTPSIQTIPLIIISRNTDSHSRIRPLFNKRRTHLVKKSSDAFSPLMSVARGLSAILNDSDVRLLLSYHHSRGTYGCPSKLCRVAKR